jgi:hypothetical protein
MKSLMVALLLCSAGSAFAQSPGPFAAPPNLGKLPPPPWQASPEKPQFKLQLPGPAVQPFLALPAPKLERAKPSFSFDVDPGMVRKPQGFAPRPSRPAPRGDLYPKLKIQPTEIALLDPVSCLGPTLKAEPIPRTFPKAKLGRIPITWDSFRMVPIEPGAACNP